MSSCPLHTGWYCWDSCVPKESRSRQATCLSARRNLWQSSRPWAGTQIKFPSFHTTLLNDLVAQSKLWWRSQAMPPALRWLHGCLWKLWLQRTKEGRCVVRPSTPPTASCAVKPKYAIPGMAGLSRECSQGLRGTEIIKIIADEGSTLKSG